MLLFIILVTQGEGVVLKFFGKGNASFHANKKSLG